MTFTVPVERCLSEEEASTLWRDTDVPEMMPSPIASNAVTSMPVVLTLDGEPILLLASMHREARAELRRILVRFPIVGGTYRGKGIRTRSQVFGNLAANKVLQRGSCRPCAAAETHPEIHARLCNMGILFASMLREALPDQYQANLQAISEVLPEWVLPGGLWTSGVVNLSASLPYHRDRNNFDAWSVMPVIRRGTRGGYLHFPELSQGGAPLVLPCDDGDVIFFNGQRFMHGVTPIKTLMTDGYRYSAVYYPVRKMRSCLPAEAELARARRTRTESEATLVERQIAAGVLRPDGSPTEKAISPRETLKKSMMFDRFGR